MRHLHCLAVCCLVLVACLVSAQEYVPSGGPVYVNPALQAPISVPVSGDETSSMLTQTVYGFLDFTTTIGNTVMVFSPQSEPAAPAPTTAAPAVIETRPSTTTAPPPTIKPSKITEKKAEGGVEKKTSPEVEKVLSSHVEVIQSPASSIVDVKEVLSSRVEVREGTQQVVNIVQKDPEQPPRIISSVVQITGGDVTRVEAPLQAISSVVHVISGPDDVTETTSQVEASEGDEPAIQGNHIVEPEYDFLSRQPSEVVDETYRVINLRPSSKFHLKPRSSPRTDDSQPTGLVTKMSGTIVKDGVTTVHETKVIGTFISGKYAQVLHSSSKIKPTAATKITKTASPSFGKARLPHLEPTGAGSNYEESIALPLEALFSSGGNANQIRAVKPSGGSQRNRFNLRNKLQDSREHEFEDEEEDVEPPPPPPPPKKPTKAARPAPTTQRAAFRASKGYSKNRSTPTTAELTTVSVFTGDAPSSRRPQQQTQRRPGGGYRPQSPTTTPATESNHRRGFKPKFAASPVEQHERSSSTSLYKFKLARPQGRWSYKTTPKPRVTIRKLDEGVENVTSTSPSPQFNPEQRSELRERNDELADNGDEIDGDVEEVKHNHDDYKEPVAVAETIKVQISTPADFKDVYYEIATIRSPYTFQVGTVKNTRFITVTSTLEKSLVEATSIEISPSNTLSEPLTENILSTLAPHYTHTLPLDSSIATLPPIALASDMSTPPLETLTETFSTTQQLLKTHILPVVRFGSETTSYTLVQSYNITRFVTAIKTLPPMEAYHFHPSRTLTDLNTRLEEAGSELHLELEFGDDDNESDQPAALRALRPDIDLANIGSELDISDLEKLNLPDGPLRYKKTPEPLPKIASIPKHEAQPFLPQPPQYTSEQLQQLALLRFLNPGAAAPQPQYVTSSRPVIRLETVYESHVLPLFDGVSTHYSTLSRPIGTITKTEYEYVTSTVQHQPLPNINNLFPQPLAQFQVTSQPVVRQTVVTETQSKVLKLTFGAKTQFTTIYSTKVVPTLMTEYVTASVPVQQQQQQQAVFNPYFPQFPYVG